jgi:hypothetical protein
MSEPLDEMHIFLKHAAQLALKGGVDNYDFRRASARALRMAALDYEEGNKSAAAHRIKISRGKIDYGMTNE